jgi:hypothetical protein
VDLVFTQTTVLQVVLVVELVILVLLEAELEQLVKAMPVEALHPQLAHYLQVQVVVEPVRLVPQ